MERKGRMGLEPRLEQHYCVGVGSSMANLAVGMGGVEGPVRI